MKSTLYEALGIQAGSPDEEVRAALRRLIRKYYAKTRDGQGNVEEALRFINHASRILGDTDRRQRYDEELALSAGTAEQKIAHVVSNAIADAGEQTDVHSESQGGPPQLEDFLDTQAEKKAAETNLLHHPGLTERVASSAQSPAVTIGLCALFGAFIAAAIAFVTPADALLVAKQVLVWLTLGLVLLTVVYGIVHGLVYSRGTSPSSKLGLSPQTDLAILNWRREKSVFLGAHQPPEDASWIFQLRMAELEREKSGRTSEPQPWNRLAARLFDYAIWGLVLALLLSELRRVGVVPAGLAYWLGHPLLAPIVITATWVPVEALLIAGLGTTPGKWLFGVYLQFSISNAYARRDAKAQVRRGLSRALRVWWSGIGCGIVPLSAVLIAVAYEKVAHDQETEWDFAEDCLVTHGPPGMLNIATGVLGLAAMLWLYGIAWHQPMADSFSWVRAGIASVAHMSSDSPATPAGGSGKISALPSPAPSVAMPTVSVGNAVPGSPSVIGSAGTPSVDPDVTALMAERRAKIGTLKAEGPRMLAAGNWRRAAELCRDWTDLDLGNADAWRCLGQTQQALGNYYDALHAFRRAKQYDPNDRALDAAIERAQRGIISEFLARYRR
jgi:DnaJ-like protein/tetratricopeptide repeat protein/RDD family protein